MRRILPVLLICASASMARADGFYFTESVGVSRVHDELGAYEPGAAMRVKIGVGARRGSWALEGWLGADLAPITGYNDAAVSGGGAYPPYAAGTGAAPSLTTYGLDLKYIKPVMRHLELYVRGSMSHADADGALQGFGGRGLGVGAGIQLKGKGSVLGLLWAPLFFLKSGPQMTAALFIDDGWDFYRLRQDGYTAVDAQLSRLTMGIAVGSDF